MTIQPSDGTAALGGRRPRGVVGDLVVSHQIRVLETKIILSFFLSFSLSLSLSLSFFLLRPLDL